MSRVRSALLPLLLLGTALLGGCVIAPYPYGPRYAYYHPYPHYYWWR